MGKILHPQDFDKTLAITGKVPLRKELIFAHLGEIIFALFISLVINSMLLVLPYYIRHVYNNAIPLESIKVLLTLSIGVLLALALSTVLRLVRSSFLSSLGKNIRAQTQQLALMKSLKAPFQSFMALKAPRQVGRYLRMARLGEFFASPQGVNLFDLPFVFIFIVAVYFLGGYLAIVPSVAIILYWITIVVFGNIRGRISEKSAPFSQEKEDIEFLFATQIDALSKSGSSEYWLTRLAEISEKVSVFNLRLARVNSAYQSVTHMLSLFTALATLGVGIMLIMHGVLTPGGLIASMMLIWRVTSPLQAAAATFSGLHGVRSTALQLEQQVRTPDEGTSEELAVPLSESSEPWSILLDKALFRYSAERNPALSSVSFEISAGEILGVTGPNEAGKRTLLDVLFRLYELQNGQLLIDGADVRHYTTAEYRKQVAYITSQEDIAILKEHSYPLILWDIDSIGIERYQQNLETYRGTSTQVFISRSTEMLKVAHKILVLDQGEVAYFGEASSDENSEQKEEVSHE